MARGWESKSIEAQQDEAARAHPSGPALSDEQRAAAARRETLQLSRARAADDLNRATSPQYRRMLQQAIAALDEQLAQLQS